MEKIDFAYPEMEAMRREIEQIALHFAKIARSGGRIVVKYDSDADGLSGALIVYRMFKCLGCDAVFEQSRSPVYRIEDALLDIAHHGDAHFVFIDFGNNDESENALRMLQKSALSISIIDHHLSKRKAGKELVATPVWHGLGYEYTSGYICYEIARRACKADYGELWKVSLYCDKSTLKYEHNKLVEERGLVLDYITATMKRERHGMAFINRTIDNYEMMHAIYLNAKDKIEEATELGLQAVKKRVLGNGIVLALLDTEKVAEGGSFPPKGKIAGRVHDRLDERVEGALITIGYGSNSAMFRANKKALGMGFNANDVIQEVKKEYGKLIISGGGHPGAAALRFRRGFKKAVLNALAKKIKELEG